MTEQRPLTPEELGLKDPVDAGKEIAKNMQDAVVGLLGKTALSEREARRQTRELVRVFNLTDSRQIQMHNQAAGALGLPGIETYGSSEYPDSLVHAQLVNTPDGNSTAQFTLVEGEGLVNTSDKLPAIDQIDIIPIKVIFQRFTDNHSDEPILMVYAPLALANEFQNGSQ